MNNKQTLFSNIKTDALSGLVVFLVALPLCLGIAVASGAPPFAGIITGIIGGIVVGFLSNSNVSVSGPAAGLIAIVLLAINNLGYEAFLLAILIAGVFQLILGYAKAGTLSNYIPSGVIEGMLTGIGIIIIKKELPHAIGYDIEHEGDFYSYHVMDKADQGFSRYGIPAITSGSTVHTSSDLVRRRWLNNDFYGQNISLQYKKKDEEISIGGGWSTYTGRHFGRVKWIEKIAIPAPFTSILSANGKVTP